jgi:hypothetical protein
MENFTVVHLVFCPVVAAMALADHPLGATAVHAKDWTRKRRNAKDLQENL